MSNKKILSMLLCIVMILSLVPKITFADTSEKASRTVYLHAQGENPTETTNNSTVYLGEDAEIYFAVDNPNKGNYENNEHLEPQYDMNGYTLRICYDPEYFDFAGNDSAAPIDYTIPDNHFPDTSKDDVEIGDDTGIDVPQSVGYYIYRHGSGTYQIGENNYKTAYITVFYSGGFVPQKTKDQLWYNLAKLTLTPRKTGSTDVFVDIDSGDERFVLELFAKNKSDELSEQTFNYNAVNGGFHHILIKDKSKPAPPIAKPSSGSYIENVTVSLSQEDNCTIYYTTDGSEPSGSSTRVKYTGPIDINVSTEIKACAYREKDGKYSNTVSYDYKILPDRPYLFDSTKKLIPDIYSENSKFDVYVSDKNVFANIEDGSEVYYTFSNGDSENPTIGTNPEQEWVKISKQNPVITIDKNRTVRLITDKMGNFSESAVYYLSIKPAPVVASHDSGEYDKKIDVTLSCKTEGCNNLLHNRRYRSQNK